MSAPTTDTRPLGELIADLDDAIALMENGFWRYTSLAARQAISSLKRRRAELPAPAEQAA